MRYAEHKDMDNHSLSMIYTMIYSCCTHINSFGSLAEINDLKNKTYKLIGEAINSKGGDDDDDNNGIEATRIDLLNKIETTNWLTILTTILNNVNALDQNRLVETPIVSNTATLTTSTHYAALFSSASQPRPNEATSNYISPNLTRGGQDSESRLNHFAH